MSTPAIDRIVTDARIDPHDSPHEAAAHVWAQVVARHELPSRSALGRLGMLERAVLVLDDVLGLSTRTIATVLNCDEATVRATRAAAREWLGLPCLDQQPCPVWDAERLGLVPGDPTMVDRLLEHTAGCGHCAQVASAARADDHQRRAGRAVGTAGRRPRAAAVGTVGAALATAALLSVGVAVAAAVTAVPQPAPPVPLVVDASPGLPSDEEPAGGWPAPPPATASPAPVPGRTSSTTEQASTDADAVPPVDGATGGGPTQAIDEVVEDVGEVVEDVGQVVEDTVQGVEEAVDDATDTVGDATDEVGDTTQRVADDVADVLAP